MNVFWKLLVCYGRIHRGIGNQATARHLDLDWLAVLGTIREWSREEREYTVIPQAFKPDAKGGGIPEARGGIPRFEGLRDDRIFPNFEASFMNCHYLSKADCHKHLNLQYILVNRSLY